MAVSHGCSHEVVLKPWPLLFLVACGDSMSGLMEPGEASVPETSVSRDGSREASAETSTTDGTSSTDARTSPGDSEPSTTEASLPDTSEKPSTDAGFDAAVDAYCDLSCEPMCVRLKQPMHACCTHVGCGCTTADAGYCSL
jgi:hypothetical protein